MLNTTRFVLLFATAVFVVACSDNAPNIPQQADLLAYCINPNSAFQMPKESVAPVKSVCSCINGKVDQMADAKFKKAYQDAHTSENGSLESMLAPLFQNVDPKSDAYRIQSQNLIQLMDHAKTCRADELAKKS
jgi:hypothetical protein